MKLSILLDDNLLPLCWYFG